MPRSPSRDLSDRHDGDRGYFHRPGWVTRVKLTLAAAGLVAVVVWAAVDAAALPRAARAHSPGDVAAPHAAWDAACATCHVGFSAGDFGPVSVFRAGDRWQAVTCETCHAGPPHHAAVDAEGAAFHARCANCHSEHGGRAAALVRVADQQCVRCHQNLPAHHTGGGGAVAPAVTGFARDHPEFRRLAPRPGGPAHPGRTLNFSHALHMTPGLTYRDEPKAAWTLARLAEMSGAAAARLYERPGQAPGSPVTLDCGSCHSTEAVGSGGRPGPRTDGAYYQPVRFDAHCKACHPVRAPAGVSGSVAVAAFDLPHGVQPAGLVETVGGEYARRVLSPANRAAAAPLGPVGRFDPRSDPALVTYRGEIDRLTRVAVNLLVVPVSRPETDALPAGGAGCAKCHDLTPAGPGAALPTVLPLTTPPVWFPGARFNHATHRAVSCASCHPGTGAAFFGAGWAAEKEPLAIAGVASCQQCHGPPRVVTAADGALRQAGGVKHACTDCHQYHAGDYPLGGRGARRPARAADAATFPHGP